MPLDEKAIFVEALARPDGSDRDAYLRETCAGQPALLRRLQELLLAHAEAEGPLDRRPQALGVATNALCREGPGAVIGPYKILEQIGEGGFGLVFMAEQQEPVRRKVALKVLKPGMDTKQVIARFEAERQALALMDHPNIAHILDGGETASGRPYFVMDLVRGIPLTDFCDQNQWSVRARLDLFVHVCEAVQHAHQKGIIHRDLKPSNIMVTLLDDRPVVKVIDFGIAKATGRQLTDATLFTGFAQLLGTPTYMSPEQAQMNGLDVDTRSDIYALGVLLYELLTGTTPFEQERLRKAGYDEIHRIIREEEPPRPSTRISTLGRAATTVSTRRGSDPRRLNRMFRGELDWIVMKCLEKDRNRRYHTANDLAEDVQRYLHDEQVQACPPSAAYRLKKFLRRHRRPLAAAALLLLALVGGIVGTTWGMLRATDEAKQKEDALTALRKEEKEARAQLFQTLWNEARALRYSGQAGARTASLQALTKAAALAPTLDLSQDQRIGLRNEAIACLSQTSLTLERQWQVFRATSRGLSFDPALRFYAVGECPQGEKGDIVVRRVEDDREVVRLEAALNQRGDPDFKFSADGTRLVVRDSASPGRERTTVWDLHRRQLLRRVTGVQRFAFHPEGRQLAIALGDHSLRLYDLSKSNQEGTPLGSGWNGPHAPLLCFNATGTGLMVARLGTPEVQIWDTTTLSLEKRLTLPEAVPATIAWHPGGRVIAAASGNRISLHDLESGQTKHLEGHQDTVTHVAFNASGDLLASLSWDSTARFWDARSGSLLLSTPASANSAPQFSSDGQHFAFRYGRTAKIFRIDRSTEYWTTTFPGATGIGNRLQISPDSRLLCIASDRGVHFWDAVTGEARGLLPVPLSQSVLTEPTGKHLITTSKGGVHRWRMGLVRDESGVRLRIGPPEALAGAEIAAGSHASLSRDGQTLVVCTEEGRAAVVDVPTRRLTARLSGQEHLAFVAISPDGRWVASSTWHGLEIVVWNARTGKRVKSWPHFRGLIGKVTFAPDGKWLVTTVGPDYQLIETENWQSRRIISKESSGDFLGPAAFSDDSRILAIADTPHEIKLLHPDSGREFVTLLLPSSLHGADMCFSPDGSRLALLTHNGLLHVWDLRLIRERLAALNLDWELPPLPPPPDEAGAPVRLEVDLGELVPIRQALARYRRAMEANPNDGVACNEVAWIYVTGPTDLRNPEEALRLAKNAVRLAPKEHNYLNTLGVAYYRLGKWKEAEATLQDAVKVDTGKAVAWDQFFLAMCYQRLGQPAKARECFERASAWCRQARQTITNVSEQWAAELKAFRAEAAAVLGLPTPVP
jgi:serine/threonine protein kinase/WD40 repeat protein